MRSWESFLKPLPVIQDTPLIQFSKLACVSLEDVIVFYNIFIKFNQKNSNKHPKKCQKKILFDLSFKALKPYFWHRSCHWCTVLVLILNVIYLKWFRLADITLPTHVPVSVSEVVWPVSVCQRFWHTQATQKLLLLLFLLVLSLAFYVSICRYCCLPRCHVPPHPSHLFPRCLLPSPSRHLSCDSPPYCAHIPPLSHY